MEQPRKVSEKRIQHLNEVITLIYKSAVDTKELKNASRKFSQLIGCFNTAFIIRFENEKGPRSIVVSDDLPREFHTLYTQENPIDHLWRPQARHFADKHAPDSEPAGPVQVDESGLVKNTSLYLGKFRLLVTTVVNELHHQCYIACHRLRKERCFTEEDCLLLELVRPHVEQAYRMTTVFKRLNDKILITDNYLNYFEIPILGLGRNREVLYRNAAATRWFKSNSLLTIENSMLCASSPRVTAAIGKTLQQIDLPVQDAPDQSSRLVIGPAKTGLILQLLPTRYQWLESLELEHQALHSVAIIKQRNASPLLDPIFRSLYRLTPSEIRILRSLAGGKSLSQIAESLHRSRETVRSHIKRIFGKTGCHSQVELISLINHLTDNK